MKIDFKDQVVLVTGASLGIGAATALEFAKCGAKVVVNYYSSREAAEELVAKIKDQGYQARAIQADVTDPKQVKAMIEETHQHFGLIDILINNAGSLLERRSIEEMEADLWDQVFSLNAKSIFLVSQAVMPDLKQKKSGVIINLTSIAARNGGGPGSGAYAAAKGAVSTFTKNMVKELTPFGIRVNAVAPGVIATPFHDRFSPPAVRENFKKMIPLGREGTAEEVAYSILFLASPFAAYITGETLEINGGMLMD